MAEFLLETLCVFLLFFIIPIILFVGLYRIGKFLINLINKKFHKQFSSSWAYYLLLIPLPLYFVLFFVGGCSFKYIDPQYYEFKRLCENETLIVYDEKLFQEAKTLINEKETLRKKFQEILSNDEKMQKLYLDYRQKNIKNKEQRISEWEEIQMKNAFIDKYINDNFEHLNILSNGKQWKINFLSELESNFGFQKKSVLEEDGMILYYFDDKSQIVLIAETRLYFYFPLGFYFKFPSDADIGGIKLVKIACGLRTFDWWY